MEIKTKFNINNTVFFLYNNKIDSGVIYGISVMTRIENPADIRVTYIVYVVGCEIELDEDKVFKTKEDIIASL